MPMHFFKKHSIQWNYKHCKSRAVFILERGNFKTRYDGYELEFSVRLAFKGTGTLPHTLNFTVDTTALKLRIDEYIVESSLQNNICTALLGILIGINMYIPGKQFPQKLYKKLTKKSLGAATSRHNLSVIKHYFKTQKLFSLAATFPILFIAYLASSLTLFYSKKFHWTIYLKHTSLLPVSCKIAKATFQNVHQSPIYNTRRKIRKLYAIIKCPWDSLSRKYEIFKGIFISGASYSFI